MTAKRTTQITAVTGVLLVIALIVYLMGYHKLKDVVLIVSSVIAGFPIAIKAIQALGMKAFSIQLLVTVAVIGALTLLSVSTLNQQSCRSYSCLVLT